jgi:pyridinium-3,5-bisthiocarboxylic acid mononucleotide nickel chelatase
MKTLYLDIASGISGDMFLGALLDLGVDFQGLERDLARLNLNGYHLHVSRQKRGPIEGVKFDVHLEAEHHHEAVGHHDHDHGLSAGHSHSPGHPHSGIPDHGHEHGHLHEHGRTFAEIRQLIADSPFTHWVKHKSIGVFTRVAQAEGKVHGQPADQVHFHEVGALDSIIDIVGACLALERMGQPRVLSGPVVDGTGWIQCAHGRLPLPAPATLEILSARGIPVSQCDEPNELVTPTGAALLAELAESFGPLRDFVPEKVGYGLGTRDTQTRPNALRVVLGEPVASRPAADAISADGHDWETDTIVTLQTNLDDINSEILGRFVELALAAGALDAFFTPIQMKKNRPAVLLTVLCDPAEADQFSELILRETTAFGVRRHFTDRRKLRREMVQVQTPYGEVAVKLGRLDGQVVQAAPEFEACRQLAELKNVPLKQVYEAALRALSP